jgi:hypothetical protein
VTAGTVVEEVRGGWSRWARPVAAASASLAVLAASAALWEYGRRAGTATPADPKDIAALATVVHLGGGEWLRRRTRRGDLNWRRALVLPGGRRPGLVAQRSKRGQAVEVVGLTGMFGSGLVWGGSTIGEWQGRITTAICVVLVPMIAGAVFQRLRHPTLVAVTSRGVVVESEELPWDQIASVRRDKEGVRLALKGEVRRVTVGGEDCAVSDERLAHVIGYYLATPHRRVTLDLNAPGPLGAVR